jgi:hypothetical protein
MWSFPGFPAAPDVDAGFPSGKLTIIFGTALVWPESFCYMLRRRTRFGTYHDAVVAELVDAQR